MHGARCLELQMVPHGASAPTVDCVCIAHCALLGCQSDVVTRYCRVIPQCMIISETSDMDSFGRARDKSRERASSC